MSNPLTAGFEDPWVTRWSRRCVSIGISMGLLVIVVLTFPALLLVSLLIDSVRRENLASTRTLLFVVLYLISEAYGLGGAIVLWLKYRLSDHHTAADFVTWNYRLQWKWAHFLVATSSRIFQMKWEIENDPAGGQGPALIFMQHSSVADTLLPIHLLSYPFGLRLKYVMKRELLWDPSIDVVGQRLENFFVDRKSTRRLSQIKALRAMVSDLKSDEAALIYPEGTRATAAKRARIVAELERTGKTEQLAYAKSLTWLLPPHMGGAMTFLDSAPGADVLFCAHFGFQGSARFSDVWHGNLVGKIIRLKFWRCSGSEVPTAASERSKWFLERWANMDAWLKDQALQNE
ncbi:MAG: 1-acyl-sn-glycerol-3-phosphate acyltransferase [Myxococcales bacterium]|nr:1-acyl-sn-glycerol-3-phosphate acyltransferase [Myxococcales bacterium]